MPFEAPVITAVGREVMVEMYRRRRDQIGRRRLEPWTGRGQALVVPLRSAGGVRQTEEFLAGLGITAEISDQR